MKRASIFRKFLRHFEE
jgi:hypothetical protein